MIWMMALEMIEAIGVIVVQQDRMSTNEVIELNCIRSASDCQGLQMCITTLFHESIFELIDLHILVSK